MLPQISLIIFISARDSGFGKSIITVPKVYDLRFDMKLKDKLNENIARKSNILLFELP